MDRHKLGKLILTSLAWPSGGRITAASTAGGLPRVVGEPAVLQGESMDAARRQLPIAYAVGGGAAGGVVLDARQSEEFILTVRRRWLGLAVLIDLRFAVWEAIVLFGLFALGSTPAGGYECIDIRWSDPDRVEHADVSQSALRAESVDGFRRYREVCSDVPYTQ